MSVAVVCLGPCWTKLFWATRASNIGGQKRADAVGHCLCGCLVVWLVFASWNVVVVGIDGQFVFFYF